MTPEKETVFEILLSEKLREISVPIVNKNTFPDKESQKKRILAKQRKNLLK